MKKLTERQIQVAQYIRDYMREYRYSPSVRDISNFFKFSVKAAHDHVRALESKNIIKTTQGISRSIEIIDPRFVPFQDMLEIPVFSTNESGSLSKVPDYTISCSVSMLPCSPKDEFFAILVTDDSMDNAGIYFGDLAIIKKCKIANDGDIVLADIPEIGLTLKYYHGGEDRVTLLPANSSYHPIYTTQLQIAGTLSLLTRQYRKRGE
ncbi:MAG: S24 family peptidase [Sphaerochaetaceae bacterium]|nr:repressor LexA [Sphaerochaetaceae bacterium]MDC7237495.1 S24 family peptidase [Sphaerochaetaceae bacterium]MDC7249792.1 S24 family peptidase [Sphaerochaetaceae bacterium]